MNQIDIAKVLKDVEFIYLKNKDLIEITVLALMNDEQRNNLLPQMNSLSEGARITDIIAFANDELNKNYAENTRESFRKNAVKPLIEAGLIVVNKDDPERAINSGRTNYTLNDNFKKLLINYENAEKYNELLTNFIRVDAKKRKKQIDELFKKREIEVYCKDICPKIKLSPGKHNIIEKFIVEELIAKGYNKPKVIYLGDTKEKLMYLNKELATKYSIPIDVHAKLPDVLAVDLDTNTLLVYEAVASTGPITRSRKNELNYLLNQSEINVKYFTVFLELSVYRRFATEIDVNTKVFIMESNMKIIYETI
ncbi:BsuBI/PstI family type II restriction endonuclease [Staphylococcus saprophyticus]|nr:BsuBI/PstI family type II restriction endonuclease [Staphylococcus saprophyticus]